MTSAGRFRQRRPDCLPGRKELAISSAAVHNEHRKYIQHACQSADGLKVILNGRRSKKQ